MNGVTLAVAVCVASVVGLANSVGVSVANAGAGVSLSVAVGGMDVAEPASATAAVGVAGLSRLSALAPRHIIPDTKTNPAAIRNMRQPR
jgi:hypothetical protein